MALLKIINYTEDEISLENNDRYEIVKGNIEDISNSTKLVIDNRMKGQYTDLFVITTDYEYYDFLSSLFDITKQSSPDNTSNILNLFKNILDDILKLNNSDRQCLIIIDILYLFAKTKDNKYMIWLLEDTIASCGFYSIGSVYDTYDKYIYVYRNSLTNSRRVEEK